MPTYQRFEDLPVLQAAIVLAERCEDFIAAAKDRITWFKRDQIDRASLSVSNNIAEGFERGTTNRTRQFRQARQIQDLKSQTLDSHPPPAPHGIPRD